MKPTTDPKKLLISLLQQAWDSACLTVQTWREKTLVEDPDNAFEWSARVFEAAAQAKVYQQVLLALNEKATVESVSEHALGEILREAENPKRSTSPQANLMAQERASAWTKVHKLAKDVLVATKGA